MFSEFMLVLLLLLVLMVIVLLSGTSARGNVGYADCAPLYIRLTGKFLCSYGFLFMVACL